MIYKHVFMGILDIPEEDKGSDQADDLPGRYLVMIITPGSYRSMEEAMADPYRYCLCTYEGRRVIIGRKVIKDTVCHGIRLGYGDDLIKEDDWHRFRMIRLLKEPGAEDFASFDMLASCGLIERRNWDSLFKGECCRPIGKKAFTIIGYPEDEPVPDEKDTGPAPRGSGYEDEDNKALLQRVFGDEEPKEEERVSAQGSPSLNEKESTGKGTGDTVDCLSDMEQQLSDLLFSVVMTASDMHMKLISSRIRRMQKGNAPAGEEAEKLEEAVDGDTGK